MDCLIYYFQTVHYNTNIMKLYKILHTNVTSDLFILVFCKKGVVVGILSLINTSSWTASYKPWEKDSVSLISLS